MPVASRRRSVAVSVMTLGNEREMPAQPASPVYWRWLRGVLLARALAGNGLVWGVVGVALDLDSQRPVGVEPLDGLPGLQERLARVARVLSEDWLQKHRIWLAGRRVGCDRPAIQELDREAHARAADGRGVGHRRALEARGIRRVEEIGNESAEVGT